MKQIQVPDDVYNSLCSIAEARGRKIKRGRNSGMVATLREMITWERVYPPTPLSQPSGAENSDTSEGRKVSEGRKEG